MTNFVTQTFLPGPRLIDGSDLNNFVTQVNNALTANTGQALTNATITNSTINGSTIATGTLQSSVILGGSAICTSSLFAQTNSTLSNVTGLSVTVTTGGVYTLAARLNGSSGATGGLKVAMGGTATMTSSNVTTWNYNQTTLNAVTNQTTWTSNIATTAAIYTDLIVQGSFTCQTGGTVTVQAAQVATNGTATIVLSGSTMQVGRVA